MRDLLGQGAGTHIVQQLALSRADRRLLIWPAIVGALVLERNKTEHIEEYLSCLGAVLEEVDTSQQAQKIGTVSLHLESFVGVMLRIVDQSELEKSLALRAQILTHPAGRRVLEYVAKREQFLGQPPG